jgi:hypothetical protein
MCRMNPPNHVVVVGAAEQVENLHRRWRDCSHLEPLELMHLVRDVGAYLLLG